MIRRQGEYYICQGEGEQEPQPQIQPSPDQEYSNVGDIKQRLTQIRQRVNQLQQQKQSKNPSQLKLSQIFPSKPQQLKDYQLSLSIPSELLLIEQKLQVVEQRVYQNQTQRQLLQKKGTIIQRVRRLQLKLQQMIKNKSIEIINQNINQYSGNLDEKEENFKQLYLYQIFNKTQGLNQEIHLLQKYLIHLNQIQTSLNSLLPLNTLITQHNQIIKRKEEVGVRVRGMFDRMKEEYKKLLEEIDAIQV